MRTTASTQKAIVKVQLRGLTTHSACRIRMTVWSTKLPHMTAQILFLLISIDTTNSFGTAGS